MSFLTTKHPLLRLSFLFFYSIATYTFIKIEQNTAVEIITKNRRSRSIKYLQKLKYQNTQNRLKRLTAPRVGEVVFYRISDDIDGNTIVEESGPADQIYTSSEFNHNFQDKTAVPDYVTNIEANLEKSYYKTYGKNSENSKNDRMPFEKEQNGVQIFDTFDKAKHIENVVLEMAGNDLNWWAYSKLHEIHISRDKLEELDVNDLKISDNLANKLSDVVVVKGKNTIFNYETNKIERPSVIFSWDSEESIKNKLKNNESANSTENDAKSAGIILELMSTGIDELNQFLNQHESVFYQYEPLKIIGDGCSAEGMSRKIEYMKELLNCNYHEMQEKIENTETKQTDSCFSGGSVFRYKSNRLCKGQFCEGHDHSKNTNKCLKDCPNVEIQELNKVCQEKLTIMKIIRICNIASLAPILNSLKFNLKILMVLRDPRAVAFSRLKRYPNWSSTNVINNLKWTCLDWQKSLEQAFFVDDEWLMNKFMVVRVEDFFGEVQFLTEASSEFLGLQKSEVLGQVSEFVGENEGEIREREENFDDWRSEIDFEIVEGVQKVCGKAMALAGYKLVASLDELKNSAFVLH